MTREEAIKELLNMKRINYTLAPDECFDMAIMALERENTLLDRVLEIIDAEAWSYCDYVIKHENGNAGKQSAACHLSENIRNAVMALKGGEQE